MEHYLVPSDVIWVRNACEVAFFRGQLCPYGVRFKLRVNRAFINVATWESPPHRFRIVQTIAVLTLVRILAIDDDRAPPMSRRIEVWEYLDSVRSTLMECVNRL